MQLRVNTFQIRKCYFLFQYHFVERYDEVSIKETTVEDSETQASANEFEIIQMFGVNARGWVDL